MNSTMTCSIIFYFSFSYCGNVLMFSKMSSQTTHDYFESDQCFMLFPIFLIFYEIYSLHWLWSYATEFFQKRMIVETIKLHVQIITQKIPLNYKSIMIWRNKAYNVKNLSLYMAKQKS